jgi:type IV pilus assembly protein PilB
LETKEYIHLETETMQAITSDQAWFYRIVPKKVYDGIFELYYDEVKDGDLLREELEVLTGKHIELVSTQSEVIERTLNRYYLNKNNKKLQTEKQKLDLGSEEYVVKLIAEAKDFRSSDIHIEVYDDQCRVRMRIDGQLVERYIIKKADYPSLINKVKIMSNLDIAEKRLPQDGRIFYKRDGYKFDIRVSILPTLHGEKVVMRLLGNDASEIDISQLGFSQREIEDYLEGVKRPNGILLISGPTGSGKTTTLYATLKLLNKESSNILTIEDPIEYTLEGINQVQLKESIGLDFGRSLRTFLRQDPDVIMVGEIRDTDTANMAVMASLSGDLVLSTIHTISAWGTVSRLVDMGVPSYLLANTLNTTVAQRLLRRLCPLCKEKHPFSSNLFPRSFRPPKDIPFHYTAKGCNNCYHTGYKGRRAIYEVIPIDPELSEKIKNKEFSVAEDLKTRNIKTLAENAFDLFEQGETTIEEIYSLLFNF